MICGSRLEYLSTGETMTCAYCRNPSEGHIRCSHGHFICNTCHGHDALQVIEATIFGTDDKDPSRIAELLIGHPSLPMLGCEHAYIAAGALLAALKNSPYAKVNDKDIKEVFARTAKQAVGGYCGLTGVCGIAPALGACFSVFLQARCGSDSEQKMVMEAVIRVSQSIAELTGPSCCKAYLRAALETAVTLFAERFGIVLPALKAPALCRHSSKHPHGCREEKCPYYQKESRDIFADSIQLKAATCHS
jgi:hypothetical protein